MPPQVATTRGGDATHVAPATRELPMTTDSHPHPHRWRCRASGEPSQLPGRSRRARVMADWALARLFRRDTTELTVLNGIGTTEPAGHAHV